VEPPSSVGDNSAVPDPLLPVVLLRSRHSQDGDVVCGKGQCAIDQYGKVFCAKEGGGALKDQYGNVKCGLGYCAVDDMGQVQCSTQPGGSAATNSYGKVKCLGSCQGASQQFCEAGR